MRDNSNNRKEDEPAVQQQHSNVTPMPKHMPFPDYHSSELCNELLMFLFTTCSAAMQFINIHRTNWWLLPQISIKNTIHLNHIDPYLILLIIVMNIRRLLYCLCLKGLEFLPQHWKRIYIEYIVAPMVLALPISCILMMYNNRNYLSIFLLVYPFIVYLLAFGFALEPFLRFNYEIKGAYFNGYPMHSCSANPNGIRTEIDVLRNDFNCRFKQVIFTSLLNAYYSAFLPCYFAQSVHYNVLWAAQHIILVFLSIFTMCTVFSFPSKYSDLLHRAALHLGYWLKVDVKPDADCAISMSISNWVKTTLWAPSMVVKFPGNTCGELYRSVGPVTVAIPGNLTHARFYKLFHNPSVIYGSLTLFQACMIFSGISLLYYATEWHFILSLSFITLTNQFTFFKLMRDYLITKRVYMAETSVSDAKLHDN